MKSMLQRERVEFFPTSVRAGTKETQMDTENMIPSFCQCDSVQLQMQQSMQSYSSDWNVRRLQDGKRKMSVKQSIT